MKKRPYKAAKKTVNKRSAVFYCRVWKTIYAHIFLAWP
ncbi:hypothetical protein B4098_2455 [Heyndrickxia coagulans]|uniref:Uncharacterized protein n=1 Tax=Heyndrickxia coagulans TaxID=1398 RepID=A0A150JN97_HEYCO|nr:hypothetical protein B4098_2455 [Heyndrickxia coagulans]